MRLLATTGGSGHSAMAFELGLQVARRLQAELTLLTVVHHRQALVDARHMIDRLAERARDMMIPVDTVVRIGRRGPEIVQEASDGQHDLIIVGEKSRHRMRTRLLGSVVTYVADRAPCSVLIAKGKISNLDRLLICDSGARNPSVLDLFLAKEFSHLAGTGIQTTILHVMSQMGAGPGLDGHQLRAGTGELIQEHSPEGEIVQSDLQNLREAGIEASPRIRHGLVIDEIFAELELGGYGLVIIGAHRKVGWESLLLDDLARQIVVKSSRPVLLLR